MINPTNNSQYIQTNDTGSITYPFFYIGQVIDNYDTVKPNSGRVKVWVPEVHPIDEKIIFTEANQLFQGKFVGDNIETAYTSVRLHHLKQAVGDIWAPICMPIIGDTGPALYSGESGLATTSENPHYNKFNDITFTNLTPPGVAYELNPPYDQFATPSTSFNANGNANGYHYGGNTYATLPKGTFASVRVGTWVLVCFLRGDVSLPIVMGAMMGADNFAKVTTGAGPSRSIVDDYQSKERTNVTQNKTKTTQLAINRFIETKNEMRTNR